MLTIEDCMTISWAKVEGEMFRERYAEGICNEILEKIKEADIVSQFRKASFNGREMVVVLSFKRSRIPNETDADMVDIHELLLAVDGYDTIASKLNYVELAYSLQMDGVLQLRLKYNGEKAANVKLRLDFQEEEMDDDNHEDLKEMINALSVDDLTAIEEEISRGWY